MDRSLESRSWKRGFAAGFLVLAVSVGGQMTTSSEVESGASCPLAKRSPDLSERVMARISEQFQGNAVAHRVALALLDAVLHASNCS
jgi:hypothetical protein